MTALLGYLWTFLNSSAGQLVVLGVLGKLFHSTVKSKDRREQILGIANRVFDVVEVLGLQQKLGSNEKWLLFVRHIFDQMRDEGLGELSGPEMAMLRKLAEQRAIIAKPAAAR